MSVTVYKALKHRILAGKQIYQNNAWKTIPANAKMWLNGAWHKIGSGAAENAVSIPADPEQSVTHENGTEPSSGTIWYITPEGAGNMDGSSWANAASGSMIHVILLSCSSGDSVYFSEGDYTIERTITLPAGVNLYGGFDANTPAWSTRNGFTKQTVFTGNNAFDWMNGSAATSGQKVDGFVIKNYSGTITGSKATLRNSIVNLGTAYLPTASHCVFISVTGPACPVSYCNVFYGNGRVGNADHVNVYNATNKNGNMFTGTATNCTAVNCVGGSDVIFYGTATNCTAVNCSGENIFYMGATNCTAVNCAGNYTVFNSSLTNCTAVNCSGARIFTGSGSTVGYNCIAVNCYAASIFSNIARNCIAINCFGEKIYYGNTAISCSAVNCSGTIFYGNRKNCISWNNSGTEYTNGSVAGCAGSTYNANLALVLGTDNSIARFTNTGYYPAQGVQDVGDCPNPISDPTGYAAYLAAFGDWHPLSNSFLVGRGAADSYVTTDADGVTRPDPPTIGAYEPVPANA